jgi:quinol monooxygenase YgiN
MSLEVKPPFHLHTEANEKILNLLNSVALGTNGAIYRHQNINQRIKELHDPLHFTLERSNKVIGNITFCRRPVAWYVRYFAFDNALQTKTNVKSRKSDGASKKRIAAFFEAILQEETNLLYAYIDPRNERSLWMSEQFGFKQMANIATQTFSRIRPRMQPEVHQVATNSNLKQLHQQIFSDYALFFTKHTYNEAPWYYIGTIEDPIAMAKTYRANWVIEQLPGKSGKLLGKIIPYVPGVRKLIGTGEQQFTVIESVYCKPGKEKTLEKLLEGILHLESNHTLIWWVDENCAYYKNAKQKVNWGLLHKINGVNRVTLVGKGKTDRENQKKPYYVTGYDFI